MSQPLRHLNNESNWKTKLFFSISCVWPERTGKCQMYIQSVKWNF